MVSTLIATSGESARTIAIIAETIVFASASGGELIDTIAPIPIPAHMTIWAAEMCVTKASSATVWPNQVHRAPTSSM